MTVEKKPSASPKRYGTPISPGIAAGWGCMQIPTGTILGTSAAVFSMCLHDGGNIQLYHLIIFWTSVATVLN